MMAADRVRELVTGCSGVCLLVRPALSMRLSASMYAGANVPFSLRSKLHSADKYMSTKVEPAAH